MLIFEYKKENDEVAYIMNNYGLIYEKFNENRKALHCVEESYRIRRKFFYSKINYLIKRLYGNRVQEDFVRN